MSYSLDSITIVHQAGFGIDIEVLQEIERQLTDMDLAAEYNPFHQVNGAHYCEIDGRTFKFSALWWGGEGSGHRLDGLIRFLEVCEGGIDLILCWAGGDSYSGLRLRDGKVTTHDVTMVLGDEVA